METEVGSGMAATTILSAIVALCAVGELESVTLAVKLKVPAALGVPEICPVEALRLKPVGNDPALTLHVFGLVPPLAASVVP
jgi:hypothetical protein